MSSIVFCVSSATSLLAWYFGHSANVCSLGSFSPMNIAPAFGVPLTTALTIACVIATVFTAWVPIMLLYALQSGMVSLNIAGFLPDSLPAW